jgi:large subunit ribosomal protein L29
MTARAVALDNLRALSGEELAAHLREQRGQLFQVRLQQTIGQVENHRQIRAIRKEIARTMTVQVEGRLAAERGEPAPAPRPTAAEPVAGRRKRAATATAVVAPARPRRARAAAADATPAKDSAAVINADAPVEDVITDIEVERVEPDVTPLELDKPDVVAQADEDKE